MCRAVIVMEKIQGSILSSGWDTQTHTPSQKSEHSDKTFFPSLLILQLKRLHAQTGKMCERIFLVSMCLAFFFFYIATFFLLIIRICLKIKSRICIKETHWNNDNGPFEKHWTYAWIEIMWVNKIWVLSLLFIKMALSSASFWEKRVLIFSWVSSLFSFRSKKKILSPGGVFERPGKND